MYPPKEGDDLGIFIAWDARTGRIAWSKKEKFAVWSGALATAEGVVFYGTLEGYLKAIDAITGKDLYRYKTAKQYVAFLSGVGGWAGIGLAAGLTDPTHGLGVVGAFSALSRYTSLGGELTVLALSP